MNEKEQLSIDDNSTEAVVHNPDNLISQKASCWLLFFVFFLQFVVPRFLGTNQHTVIFFTEIIAILIPCAVFLYLNYIDLKAVPEILSLNTISVKEIILCVLIGITAQFAISLVNVPVLWFIDYKLGWLPAETVSTPISFSEFLLGLVTIALVPAVCEEILMRGIVLTSTKPLGYRASLLIGGLYFALLHNQAENFLGHFFLGVLLCYIVWTTGSIFGGIIVHFFLNAFGMGYYYFIDTFSASFPWLSGVYFTWSVVFASVAVFCILINHLNKKDVKRYKSVNFAKNLAGSFINIPILILLAGYLFIQYNRFN